MKEEDAKNRMQAGKLLDGGRKKKLPTKLYINYEDNAAAWLFITIMT